GARKIACQPALVPLICNPTGLAIERGQHMGPAYWHEHARQAVQFARSMHTLAAMGVNVLVEIGPSAVLLGMAERCWPTGAAGPVIVPSLQRGRSDSQQMAEGLASLYTSGLLPNFRAFDQPWQ